MSNILKALKSTLVFYFCVCGVILNLMGIMAIYEANGYDCDDQCQQDYIVGCLIFELAYAQAAHHCETGEWGYQGVVLGPGDDLDGSVFIPPGHDYTLRFELMGDTCRVIVDSEARTEEGPEWNITIDMVLPNKPCEDLTPKDLLQDAI